MTRAWNVDLVKAPAAWGLLPKTPDGHIDWGDIKVCHLDTGYTDHPVFQDPLTGKSCLRPEEGRNFIEGGPPLDPLDSESRRGKSFGHGTRTASVICGGAVPQADGSRLEIGVAPGLPLVPCRVVNWVVLLTAASRERVAAGIRHAIACGCQVVSMSLGGLAGNAALNRAVIDAYGHGIILVAAAGQETDRVTFPGRYARTITCAAVGESKTAWKEQYWREHPHEAERIDVWAPGDEVPVATLQVDGPAAGVGGSVPSGFFESSSNSSASKGSSYATAHVAAAAALWLRHREADISTTYPNSWQRVEAFRALLGSSKGSLSGFRSANGTGLLDIKKLLDSALPPAASLERVPGA
jgi:subtilisin family serine protease